MNWRRVGGGTSEGPTIDEDGIYVHRETQQVAHRGPVLHAGVDRVSENGSHTLLTHCRALESRNHKHHPEVDQNSTFVVVTVRTVEDEDVCCLVVRTDGLRRYLRSEMTACL